jgi:hypothetical protein
VGQTYDLCGPETLTLREIVDEILRVMRRRRLKWQVPAGLAGVQAACLEFMFRRVLGRSSPLSQDQLLMLQEDNVGNPVPASELFGLSLLPLRTGIAQYLGSEGA